jgi:D-sedoheptulose 7-phosphate isomerase
MSMLAQRIQQHFIDGADLTFQSAESLARPIEDAAQAMVSGFTAGGRLWIAGFGPAAALAQLMVTHLVGRFERARPGLAALLLGGDGAQLTALAAAEGLDKAWAHQAQTLGQPGDLLLVIDHDGQHPALLPLVQAAHARDMSVIALTGRSAASLGSTLNDTDLLLEMPHDRPARVLEMQLLTLHGLCDAIDHLLLGEQEPA